MEGSGKDLIIDASTLDLGNITQNDLQRREDETFVIDLFDFNPKSQAGLALGKITLVAQGNNQYSINTDRYDFNMEWDKGFSKRNIATFGAYIVHNPFISSFFISKPFNIHFTGTITINP